MKRRSAFSLIEVIFVLVILGIVASIASNIIAQVYESYIMQRAYYNVSTKTELSSNQIVNLLTYRIQGTTISKNHEAFDAGDTPTFGTNWLPIKDIQDAGNVYQTIEWIGYDNDSYSAYDTPTWTGVANYTTASRDSFITPGSNLTRTREILNNLSNSEVNLTAERPAAVIFAQKNNYYTGQLEYDPSCMGLVWEGDTLNTNCIFPVMRSTDDNLSFTRNQDTTNAFPVPKRITERYKLAWSAYAIVPEVKLNEDDQNITGTGNKPLYDLYLYSNYQPWNGERYTDQGVSKNLLMPNVSVFKFSEVDGVMRFKLCAQEDIGQREPDGTPMNVSICKEKAVIR